MADYLEKAGLKVDAQLAGFVESEALPGDRDFGRQLLGRACRDWSQRFMPRNRELLAIRDAMQGKIDAWHRDARTGGERSGRL